MAAGQFEGEPLRLRKDTVASREDLRRRVRELVKGRYLRPDEDFYSSTAPEEERYYQATPRFKVFRIADLPDGSAEDIAALVDPFCYISHLSAMQRHGLTNRNPAALHISTPAAPLWRDARDKKMAVDYGDNPPVVETMPNGLQPVTVVRLEHIKLPPVLRGRKVETHTTKYPANFRPVRGSFARIAAIGDVFAQMLDNAQDCGGMAHVVEVWAKEGRPFIEEIIKVIDHDHTTIVKMRAGYLLERVLSVKDPRIDAWQKFAQRGSSRKLDASKPYLPTFSEKWMLSVNVESEFLPPSPRP
jgi:predicted transcriptional regulator of viral defense system